MISRRVHETPADSPPTFERRAFVRHPRRLESFWQFLGVRVEDLADAEVLDLSMTGLGLRVKAEFAVGLVLVVRLPTATMGWNTHLIRVIHCHRLEDSRFQVGCTFVKPLSVAQLEALLA